MAEKLKFMEKIVAEKPSDGFTPKTAEENYEFNTKTKIPEGIEIGFIDGNPKNAVFANLKLVASTDKSDKGKDDEKQNEKGKIADDKGKKK